MKRWLEIGVPLILGGLIDIAFRPASLWMFAWARTLGLGASVEAFRALARPFGHFVPAFVTFSLPDGLWALSLCSLTGVIWRDRLTGASAPWLIASPLIAIGSEIGQGFGLVPGTFDVADLLALVVACALGSRRLFLHPKPLEVTA